MLNYILARCDVFILIFFNFFYFVCVHACVCFGFSPLLLVTLVSAALSGVSQRRGRKKLIRLARRLAERMSATPNVWVSFFGRDFYIILFLGGGQGVGGNLADQRMAVCCFMADGPHYIALHCLSLA